MREILFRAKTVCDGNWVYGGITWNPSRTEVFIHSDWDEGKVIPETVGQFTGLTDKNGVRVFEGDIVCIFDGEYFSGVVKYSNEQGSFTVDDTSLHYWVSDIEVIGNVHDNPELLNK